jgi:hypothetical protein
MSERLEALDRALESLRERDLDPESAGGAIALQFLLEPGGQAAPSPASSPRSSAAPDPGTEASSGPVERLSRWVNASPEQIGDLFAVGDQSLGVHVPTSRLPGSKADRQRVLALLTIAAHRIAFEHDLVPASAVNRVVDDYAALDQNLPKNVATQSHLITRRGKRGSWRYRVTQPGLDRARELIMTLIETEDPVRL